MKNFLSRIISFVTIHPKIAIIFALVLVFVAWRVFFPSQKQPTYETTQVEKGTLVSSLAESGQVLSANRTSTTTQASGVIIEIDVQNGQTVIAGQKIAVISLDQVGLQRQSQAWSSYLTAKNTLDGANANLHSLQSKMFVANQTFVKDKGTINPVTDDPKYIEENADWLAAEAAYKNQQNVINQAQASVTSNWYAYQAYSPVITAPVDGIITDLVITEGMQIGSGTISTTTTSSSTPSQFIATIKTKGAPIITVNLSETDVVKISAGQKATVTFDALSNKTFTGRILGINTSGVVQSGVTTYPANIILDLSDDVIFPNMSANATIITKVKHDVLLVSTQAVQTVNGRSTVRILKNGNVTSVPVEIGDASDTQIEILSGINEGDTVISSIISQQAAGLGTSPFSSNFRFGGFGGGGRSVGR